MSYITPLPPAPVLGAENFEEVAGALLDAMPLFATELDDAVTLVVDSVGDSDDAAAAALASAGVATTKAGESSVSAAAALVSQGVASTKADDAADSAAAALASQGVATTKAGEASDSAAAALASQNLALQYKNETAAISESGLPPQTGNSGKSLTTNGTITEWTAITAAMVGAEPIIGNPASDGMMLISTTAGVRSWGSAPVSIGSTLYLHANCGGF
jgi:hypothetical protein